MPPVAFRAIARRSHRLDLSAARAAASPMTSWTAPPGNAAAATEHPVNSSRLANVILHTVVLVECWTLTTNSAAPRLATMALIIVVVALLWRWTLNLMDLPEHHALD
jgi:hypothetical protein